MAKPLPPHASFCTCAECTHASFHVQPYPTDIATSPEIPSDPPESFVEISDVDCRVCNGKGEVYDAAGGELEMTPCPRCSPSGAV